MKRPEFGNLCVWAVADIAVLELEFGEFGFVDSGMARLKGDQRLTCQMTVRNGAIVWDLNGLSRPDYEGQGDYVSLDRDMSDLLDWTGYDNS